MFPFFFFEKKFFVSMYSEDIAQHDASCDCGLTGWLENAQKRPASSNSSSLLPWLSLPPKALAIHVRNPAEESLLFSLPRIGGMLDCLFTQLSVHVDLAKMFMLDWDATSTCIDGCGNCPARCAADALLSRSLHSQERNINAIMFIKQEIEICIERLKSCVNQISAFWRHNYTIYEALLAEGCRPLATCKFLIVQSEKVLEQRICTLIWRATHLVKEYTTSETLNEIKQPQNSAKVITAVHANPSITDLPPSRNTSTEQPHHYGTPDPIRAQSSTPQTPESISGSSHNSQNTSGPANISKTPTKSTKLSAFSSLSFSPVNNVLFPSTKQTVSTIQISDSQISGVTSLGHNDGRGPSETESREKSSSGADSCNKDTDSEQRREDNHKNQEGNPRFCDSSKDSASIGPLEAKQTETMRYAHGNKGSQWHDPCEDASPDNKDGDAYYADPSLVDLQRCLERYAEEPCSEELSTPPHPTHHRSPVVESPTNKIGKRNRQLDEASDYEMELDDDTRTENNETNSSPMKRQKLCNLATDGSVQQVTAQKGESTSSSQEHNDAGGGAKDGTVTACSTEEANCTHSFEALDKMSERTDDSSEVVESSQIDGPMHEENSSCKSHDPTESSCNNGSFCSHPGTDFSQEDSQSSQWELSVSVA